MLTWQHWQTFTKKIISEFLSSNCQTFLFTIKAYSAVDSGQAGTPTSDGPKSSVFGQVGQVAERVVFGEPCKFVDFLPTQRRLVLGE